MPLKTFEAPILARQHYNHCMADRGALTLSEMQRYDHISLEDLLRALPSANRSDVIGCIFWLKKADQIQRYQRHGPNKVAYNHPCLVVDLLPQSADEVWMCRICIITSFKHKTPQERDVALSRRRGLVPILPHSTHLMSTLLLNLKPGVTLQRDSWVNLAQIWIVDATMIKFYDHELPSLRYKFTPSSINAVRNVFGISTPRTSCKPGVQAVQVDIGHVASRATTNPSAYIAQRVIAADLSHLSGRTPLLEDTGRRTPYGAAVCTYPDTTIMRHQLLDEARRGRQTLPIPGHPQDGQGSKSLLLRIFELLPSWRLVRLWLPSSQTILALVMTGLLVAAGGGVIYGGFLLIISIYTALSACYREVAAVGAKIIASLGGAWKWCTHIGRVFGLKAVRGKEAVLRAIRRIVAIARALLGRQ